MQKCVDAARALAVSEKHLSLMVRYALRIQPVTKYPTTGRSWPF